MLIDKLIFLIHGGGSKGIPGQQVPPGTSPLAAMIIVAVLIAIGIGIWILFARKKKF